MASLFPRPPDSRVAPKKSFSRAGFHAALPGNHVSGCQPAPLTGLCAASGLSDWTPAQKGFGAARAYCHPPPPFPPDEGVVRNAPMVADLATRTATFLPISLDRAHGPAAARRPGRLFRKARSGRISLLVCPLRHRFILRKSCGCLGAGACNPGGRGAPQKRVIVWTNVV